MHAESVERVVIPEAGLNVCDHQVTEDAGNQSNHQCGSGAHETGRWRDSDQSSDRSGDGAECAGFSIAEPLRAAPANNSRGGRKVRGNESACGQTAGAKCAAGIKSKPTYPQEACSKETQYHAVRSHRLFGIAHPLAQIQPAYQRRDTGSNMHHPTAAQLHPRKPSPQSSLTQP